MIKVIELDKLTNYICIANKFGYEWNLYKKVSSEIISL